MRSLIASSRRELNIFVFDFFYSVVKLLKNVNGLKYSLISINFHYNSDLWHF